MLRYSERRETSTRVPVGIIALVALLAASLSCGRGDDAAPGAAAEASAAGGSSVATAIRFVDGTAASGVQFRHEPHRSTERYMPEIMGSGVAIVDVDRNGAPDIVLINGGRLGERDRPADALNRLYLNDGRGRFSDASAAWRLPSPGYGMGVAAGDIDNDGWVDLYLTTYGGRDRLLRNTGTHFEDVTEALGVHAGEGWSSSAGFLDLENDGDLDLYVARYVDYTLERAIRCYDSELHVYCTPDLYDALPDRLFRNDGARGFVEIAARAGLAEHVGKGLALAVGDVDLDGFADVYVAADQTRNLLYVHAEHGLREIGLSAGVGLSEGGREEASMGADLSDVDGDGRPDLVCTNFQGETNSFYLQLEPGFFHESSDAVGIGADSRAHLGFGADFFDADNDGDEDLLVVNGHIDDRVSARNAAIGFEQPNLLFENLGGARFRNVTELAGGALADRQVSRGLASSDLDGDGDLDFVVANNGGTAQVAINESLERGGFVSLWLEGRGANRSAIGARVVARLADHVLERHVTGASSYMSVCDPRVHIGLGSQTELNELTVHWPGGATQTLRGIQGNRFYHLVEGSEARPYVPGERLIAP